MDEIKPCPVCGSPGVAWRISGRQVVNCGGPSCEMAHLPIAAWNKLSSAMGLIEDITTHLDSPS